MAAGYCVAALDCRGQGGKSEDVGGIKGTTLKGHIIRGLQEGPEKLLFRSIYLDTAQLADITHEANISQAKVAGQMVWNYTIDRPVWAVGSGDSDIWVDAAGSTVHTPV